MPQRKPLGEVHCVRFGRKGLEVMEEVVVQEHLCREVSRTVAFQAIRFQHILDHRHLPLWMLRMKCNSYHEDELSWMDEVCAEQVLSRAVGQDPP